MKPSRRPWLLAAAVAVLVAGGVAAIVAGSGGGGHRHGSPTLPTGSGAPSGPTTPTGPGAPPAPGPPAQPPPAQQQFGANVNRLFNDQTYSAGQIAAQLRALGATGATLARSDALWESAEPTPPVDGQHRFDWRFDDSIAGSLAARGLQWLPILDYSAPWDQSEPGIDHSPPRSSAAFSAFAGAFAARYGAGGTFWRSHPGLTADPVVTYEIWNEPDNGAFWSPTPDPAAYADLYLASRDAITAVDPHARVIVGGLTKPPVFLPEMVRSVPELVGHIDGVAVHPYGPSAAVVLGRIRAARATLASLGLANVPIYLTELGWTTHPAGTLDFAPEARRPRDILTTLSALGHTNCRIAATLIYTWVTPERSPADKQDWFGIHPPHGGTNADTAAFTAGIRRAGGPGRTRAVCRSG